MRTNGIKSKVGNGSRLERKISGNDKKRKIIELQKTGGEQKEYEQAGGQDQTYGGRDRQETAGDRETRESAFELVERDRESGTVSEGLRTNGESEERDRGRAEERQRPSGKINIEDGNLVISFLVSK